MSWESLIAGLCIGFLAALVVYYLVYSLDLIPDDTSLGGLLSSPNKPKEIRLGTGEYLIPGGKGYIRHVRLKQPLDGSWTITSDISSPLHINFWVTDNGLICLFCVKGTPSVQYTIDNEKIIGSELVLYISESSPDALFARMKSILEKNKMSLGVEFAHINLAEFLISVEDLVKASWDKYQQSKPVLFQTSEMETSGVEY